MQPVNVKGYGVVPFPDDISVDEIRATLRRRYTDLADNDLLQGASEYGAPTGNVAAPYNPSLMERTAQGIGGALYDSGIISNRAGAQQIGKNVTAIGELLPGIGDVAAVDDTIRAYNKGNYGEAALNAVGVAPLLGDAAIFAGVLAKNADLGALRKAKLLEDTGADRNRIWKETGWANDNGDWKFEIDDSASKGNPYQIEPKEAYSRLYDDAIIAGDGSLNEKLKAIKPYREYSTDDLINERNRKWSVAEGKFDSGDENALSLFMDDVKGIDAMLGQTRSSYAPVKGYLKHDELYNQYPDVGDIHTRVDDELGSLGSYNERGGGYSEGIQLKQRPDFNKPKSTLLHETQHAIQQREGFQRGGSPKLLSQSGEYRKRARKRMDAIKKEKPALAKAFADYNSKEEALNAKYGRDVDKWPDEIAEKYYIDSDKLLGMDGGEEMITLSDNIYDPPQSELEKMPSAMDQYQRLAGEAEARNVQTRMNMTPDERRVKPPWETLDVPEDELTYRGGSGVSKSQAPVDVASSIKPEMPSGKPIMDEAGNAKFIEGDDGKFFKLHKRSGDWVDITGTAGEANAKAMKAKGLTPNADKSPAQYRAESAAQAEGYKMQHTAPLKSDGNPSGVNVEDAFPGMYSGHSSDYLTGVSYDDKAIRIIQGMKGKPEKSVTIYRAVPKDVKEINATDWITTTKEYAQDHMEGEKGWHILSKKVKAKDIATDGNSIHEFGYDPTN